MPKSGSRVKKSRRPHRTRGSKIRASRRKSRMGRRTRTRRQCGGKTNERDCQLRAAEKPAEEWVWVPGAKHTEFSGYYDCDLTPRGACCRKVKQGQTKCSICLEHVKKCEMKGKSKCTHKVCADCYERFPAGANCPECRAPGFKPAVPGAAAQDQQEARNREELLNYINRIRFGGEEDNAGLARSNQRHSRRLHDARALGEHTLAGVEAMIDRLRRQGVPESDEQLAQLLFNAEILRGLARNAE